MENVLLTGGAGYIGSVLTGLLLEAGYKVTVVDNFLYDRQTLNQYCAHQNFHVLKSDVRDTSNYKQHVAKADIIIPLAAIVGAPACASKPKDAAQINEKAVFDLFDMTSHNQLIIMPTTNSAYGTGDENNYCDEESPLNPISQYAIEKVAVEARLMERQNSISYRLATVFGMSPRMRMDLLVNDFVYRAKTDGFVVLYEPHFKRNYIHIRDVTRAFIHAINNFDTMRGNVYNVGLSDANISKFELCERIQQQLPKFIFPIADNQKDPDQRNYIVSNEKLENTGFKPIYGIDFGIEELIKGYTMISKYQYTNL